MKLAADSHSEVQSFFRAHMGDRALVLPPVTVHGGLVARALMSVVGMDGITFGRNVFVRAALVGRDARGHATIPARLLVHEAAHVLQYEQRGYVRFFRDYLRGYWRALRAGKRWDARGRMAAYLAIAEEREARAAEHAYVERGGEVAGEAGT
jgi:hypothetical protein